MSETYKHDLDAASRVMDAVADIDGEAIVGTHHYVRRAVVEVWNSDGDYAVGTVIYEDEQSRFVAGES